MPSADAMAYFCAAACCCLPRVCQVDEVKGIMLQNVEQVLVRGERLDVLVDRTDDLRDQVGSSDSSRPCSSTTAG